MVELGDLTPIRAVLKRVEDRLDYDRATRPSDDPAVLALADVERWLTEALGHAENAELSLSVEDYAAKEGITIWGVYRRIKKGKLVVSRTGGGRIRIPVANDAAA